MKNYTIFRLVMTVGLAMLISISVSAENYVIPIFAVMASLILMLVVRRNVKDVMADERDYEISGKAARWAISIYAFLAFLGTMIAFSFKSVDPVYEAVGSVLAYSACLIMLTYSLLFSFFRRHEKEGKRRLLSIALIVVIAFLGALATLRFFSGEDDWICQDGQWVRHGHPDAAMPATKCE